MDATYTIPPDSQGPTLPMYVRERVVALRDALRAALGPAASVEIWREPSAAEEQQREIRYALAIRLGGLTGADLDVSLVAVEAEAEAKQPGDPPQPARQPRLWLTAATVTRITDRIDLMILRLGCVLGLMVAVVAAVVAAGAVEVPWQRFFSWLGAIALSYAILFALLVPGLKKLLGLLARNRKLMAGIHAAADRVMGERA